MMLSNDFGDPNFISYHHRDQNKGLLICRSLKERSIIQIEKVSLFRVLTRESTLVITPFSLTPLPGLNMFNCFSSDAPPFSLSLYVLICWGFLIIYQQMLYIITLYVACWL